MKRWASMKMEAKRKSPSAPVTGRMTRKDAREWSHPSIRVASPCEEMTRSPAAFARYTLGEGAFSLIDE
jgi:hypothetical protein